MGKPNFIRSEIEFEADMAFLHSMMDWIRDQLLLAHLSEDTKRKIEIALEEALVNIISYAYKARGGNIHIAFTLREGLSLAFTIKDHGTPFNPARKEDDIESDLPLEQREEGGLGIPLIHKIMDVIEYSRNGSANVLTLEKKIAA